MQKSLLIMLVSFFYNIGPNLAQILPQGHTNFVFAFAGFQWNILGDSININNFNCIKALKVPIFGPSLCKKKGVSKGHTQNKGFFFSEMIKADHKLSKTFYFYQNITCFGWAMFFYFVVMFFFCEKGSFPAITAVTIIALPCWKINKLQNNSR